MRPRSTIRRVVRVLLLVLVLVLAAPAAGQEAPRLGAPSEGETATQAPATTSDASDGGLATWQEALIFSAGLILLGGIAFAIVADARRRTGDRRAPVIEAAGAGGGHRHKQQSKQRARAKARAARAQRRRNR
jgi:hypothetical protein